MAFGPFHRRESPTQTKQDAIDQIASQEVWGKAARMNGIPSVKAYRNTMPAGQRGIEFTTFVSPTSGSGTPIEARWYPPSPGNPPNGVDHRQRNGEDYAAIAARVVNLQP